jgi:hypothetical protein
MEGGDGNSTAQDFSDTYFGQQCRDYGSMSRDGRVEI